MAVGNSTKQNTAKIGRPLKSNEISTEEIIEIMYKWSKHGKFFSDLPACIHKDSGVEVSLSYLEKIKDESFLRAKSVCAAYCCGYWDEQMHLASIPASVWIFIRKNVSKWTDNRNVIIDASVVNTDNPSQAKEQLDQLKRMLVDKV